ncbi:hypothetical protein Pelo_11722 [Pelomyxa schiedti]|nr:hypothetical protein Pelo_11722 [Pelomyxa schiedti]
MWGWFGVGRKTSPPPQASRETSSESTPAAPAVTTSTTRTTHEGAQGAGDGASNSRHHGRGHDGTYGSEGGNREGEEAEAVITWSGDWPPDLQTTLEAETPVGRGAAANLSPYDSPEPRLRSPPLGAQCGPQSHSQHQSRILEADGSRDGQMTEQQAQLLARQQMQLMQQLGQSQCLMPTSSRSCAVSGNISDERTGVNQGTECECELGEPQRQREQEQLQVQLQQQQQEQVVLARLRIEAEQHLIEQLNALYLQLQDQITNLQGRGLQTCALTPPSSCELEPQPEPVPLSAEEAEQQRSLLQQQQATLVSLLNDSSVRGPIWQDYLNKYLDQYMQQYMTYSQQVELGMLTTQPTDTVDVAQPAPHRRTGSTSRAERQSESPVLIHKNPSSTLRETDFYVVVDEENPFQSLPTIILLHVVSFLPLTALRALQLCSKRMNSIVETHLLSNMFFGEESDLVLIADPPSFLSLSDELLKYIFSFFDIPSLCKLQRVCTRFYQVICGDSFNAARDAWKRLQILRFKKELWKPYEKEVDQNIEFYQGIRSAPKRFGYSLTRKFMWDSDARWFIPILGVSYVAHYACLPVTVPLSWAGKAIAPFTTYRQRYTDDKRIESKYPMWKKDSTISKCQCGVVFGVLARRHHCRCCRNIFCYQCVSHRVVSKLTGYDYEVRVCTRCYTYLRCGTLPKDHPFLDA